MAGVGESLKALLWQGRHQEDRAKREVWVIGGPNCDLNILRGGKELGALARAPPPAVEDMELATLPASPPATHAAPSTPQLQEEQQQQQPKGAQEAAAATEAQLPCVPTYAHCHSFDTHCERAVSVLKFAPGSADRLAWAGADGSVYVATVEQPPRLLQVLERHRDKVPDLAWSPDGAMLLSCSQDGTACLWEVGCGRLVRSLRNLSGPLGCCRFHPANPNLILLGTAAGELLALNASTGCLIARTELQAAPMSGVGACCLEVAGRDHLLVADSRGCLHLFDATLHDGTLQHLVPLARFPPPSNRFHEPACLEYTAHSALAGGPGVLLVLSSGEAVLSRLQQRPWQLEVVQEVRTAPASAKVKASLRPGAAWQQPELLLTGSEDCRVHLVDISQAQQPPVLLAALEHHRAPVLSVAWSEDERRLASSDKKGVVIVWEADGGQVASTQPAAVQQDLNSSS